MTDDLSDDYLEEIRELIEDFKNRWQNDDRPNIDTYLGYVDDEVRDDLLEQLVIAEIKQLTDKGESIDRRFYAKYGSRINEIVKAQLGETLAGPDPSLIGLEKKSIGRYRLLQQIGKGGMGVVYMAEQVEPIRRKVAVKLIRVRNDDDAKGVVARFEAERQALAVMDHENISQIFDAGEEDGIPYFVMELVKGVPITEYCDNHKLSIQDRLGLFLQVCSAVQHAHSKGIIHRDLKPSNILVAQYDGKPVPKVIDFGLAKPLGSENWLTDKTMFTEFGMVVGTLQYMSPEQAELNQLDVDIRSDIYSLGIILYELLSGSPPLDNETLKRNALLEVLKTIQEQEPIRPSDRLDSNIESSQEISLSRSISNSNKLQQILRGELDWIVMKAIDRDRHRRYETVNSFLNDVESYLAGDVIQACPPSRIYLAQKFLRKRWKSVLTASTLLMIAVGSILFTTYWIQKEKFNQIQLEQANSRAARSSYTTAINFWQKNRIDKFYEYLEKVPKRFQYIEWRLAKNHSVGKVLCRDQGGIHALAVSDDQKTMATAGDKGEIVIWDCQTWEQKLVIPSAHGIQLISALCFHPQQKLLISGGIDNHIRFWNTETGEPASGFSPLVTKGSVRSIAISADGNRLAAGGGKDYDHPRKHQDEFASMWEMSDLSKRKDLAGFKLQINKVGFSSDGNKLVTAGGDLLVRLWDTATGNQENSWKLTSLVWDAELIGSKNAILAITEYAHIFLLDASESDKVIWRREAPSFKAVAVSSDEKLIANSGVDGRITIRDSTFGEVQRTFTGHMAEVRQLAFVNDNTSLVSVSPDGTARAWDLTRGRESFALTDHDQAVNTIDFSSDSKLLVSGGGANSRHPYPALQKKEPTDNLVRIWDLDSGECIEEHSLHDAPITDVEFDPQSKTGEVFASSSADGIVCLFDRTQKQKLFETEAHQGKVHQIRFNASGLKLATVGADGFLCVWNSKTGSSIYRELIENAGELTCVDWIDDDSRVVVGARSGNIRMIDINTNEEVWEFSSKQNWSVYSIAYSRDTKQIVSGQSSIVVLDLDGNQVGQHSNHAHPTYSINLHADEGVVRMLTGSHDGDWKLWDGRTMDELRSIRPFSTRKWNHIFDAKISPDGRRIAIANSDRAIQIWNCFED